MRSGRVVVVVYDSVRLLDVTGPLEVFGMANEHGAEYELLTASPGGADVRTTTGTRLGVDVALEEVTVEDGTLVVPGGPHWQATVADEPLLAQVRRLAGQARRTASVCAGAFALAAAGLLDGRRAATHWEFADQLARRYPAVEVDSDAIFVRDGPVLSSAGVTAGIDLSLALVEEDLGAEAARLVAKHLVVFLQRPGGQSQFSVRLTAGPAGHELLRRLMDRVTADPAGDHSLASLAHDAGVSVRHLTRLFREQAGTSVARFVESTRLEAARQLLERGTDPLDVVARRTGFGSSETLRRVFTRELGVPPSAYRARFRTAARPRP
ncbi:MAG TPA: DJ-1/PfpI family protein [Amycolatopsis sp.]|jgi:transcriptional regulator GlxA family with amidase domain